MTVTLKQVFDTKEKADGFYRSWRAYHQGVGKMIGRRTWWPALIFGGIGGVLISVQNGLAQSASDEGINTITFILILFGIAIVASSIVHHLSLHFNSQYENGLRDYADDQRLSFNLKSACHSLSISDVPTLKEAVKHIPLPTDWVKVEIGYSDSSKSLTFTPKSTFVSWVYTLFFFLISYSFVLYHLVPECSEYQW